MRPELVTLGAANACSECGAHLAAETRAWWLEDEQAFICTTCVPVGDDAAHSLSHQVVGKREPRPGWR